ncbi:MAG TPA: DinB family protein [Anaerolineales bacterium]|nr:DinB family protein [Anaerolineales bacterium]
MISALLFDLDDTLLGNDLGIFVPAYFDRLTRHFAADVRPEQFIAELLTGTRAMLANADPARVLDSVFADRFYPALGWEAEAWRPRIETFYRTGFTELRGLTARLPAARAVMEWAFAQGYQVVIATTPLFPLSAIQERLRWAGIDDFPYARITSYENSHFAKPHPEYFAEILAHLGRRTEEVLVVGNDWSDDIVPAAELGVAQFWIAPPGSAVPDVSRTRLHPTGIGDLDTFLEWAQTALPTLAMPPAPATALPYLLMGSLAAALGALEGLTEAAWHSRPAEAEWSLVEIACHLRDVDREIHLPRLQTVVDSENPFLVGIDADPWAAERNYQSESGPEASQGFIAARKELYAFLTGQPEAVWARPARHAYFGPTHLAEIVGWILDHDRVHLGQLRETRRKSEAPQ